MVTRYLKKKLSNTIFVPWLNFHAPLIAHYQQNIFKVAPREKLFQ